MAGIVFTVDGQEADIGKLTLWTGAGAMIFIGLVANSEAFFAGGVVLLFLALRNCL